MNFAQLLIVALFVLVSNHSSANSAVKAGDRVRFLDRELIIELVAGSHVVLYNPNNNEFAGHLTTDQLNIYREKNPESYVSVSANEAADVLSKIKHNPARLVKDSNLNLLPGGVIVDVGTPFESKLAVAREIVGMEFVSRNEPVLKFKDKSSLQVSKDGYQSLNSKILNGTHLYIPPAKNPHWYTTEKIRQESGRDVKLKSTSFLGIKIEPNLKVLVGDDVKEIIEIFPDTVKVKTLSTGQESFMLHSQFFGMVKNHPEAMEKIQSPIIPKLPEGEVAKAGDRVKFLDRELIIELVAGSHVVLYNPNNNEFAGHLTIDQLNTYRKENPESYISVSANESVDVLSKIKHSSALSVKDSNLNLLPGGVIVDVGTQFESKLAFASEISEITMGEKIDYWNSHRGEIHFHRSQNFFPLEEVKLSSSDRGHKHEITYFADRLSRGNFIYIPPSNEPSLLPFAGEKGNEIGEFKSVNFKGITLKVGLRLKMGNSILVIDSIRRDQIKIRNITDTNVSERVLLSDFIGDIKKNPHLAESLATKSNSKKAEKNDQKATSVDTPKRNYTFKVGDIVRNGNQTAVIAELDGSLVILKGTGADEGGHLIQTFDQIQDIIDASNKELSKSENESGVTSKGRAKDAKIESTKISKNAPIQLDGKYDIKKLQIPKWQQTPVKDEKGEQKEAFEIIGPLVQNIIQDAIENNAKYIPDEDLRVVEDQVLRNLLKPEGGSVKVLAPAGVGKSYLIQRLAARIALRDLPPDLKEYRFFSFSSSSLQAGSMYTGMMDARINAMIEASRTNKIVWIVDEAHSLAGAGTHSGNSNDIFQTLKPHLASGRIKMIGLSTPDEWSTAFSTDAALDRRFARVDMVEPSGDKLIRILESWLVKYNFQPMSKALLREVIRLSDEFGSDGAQPSRAAMLLTEIFSMMKFNGSNKPVSKADIIAAAKRIYGIDPSELEEGKRRERYQNLENALEELAGQDQAKEELKSIARRVLVGMQDRTKPRYRMMFGGPKGQGKTEIVKLFANAMGLPADNRLLMSNFTTPHQLDELKTQIGSMVSKNAFTVLFFDEIEKAHPSIQKALLGILDSGFLTYQAERGQVSRIKTVRLRNTSVFMATNAGQNYIESLRDKSQFDESKFREQMERDGLDEFMLDRMEAVIPFFFLDLNEFKKVLKIHIQKAIKEAKTNTGVSISISNLETMIENLAQKHFKPKMSNRDALRIVSETVRNDVTKALFFGGRKTTDVNFEWNGKELMSVGNNTKTPTPKKSPAKFACEMVL